jgi:hypothetical protein
MKRIILALTLPAILHAQSPDTTMHVSHVATGAKVGAIAGTVSLGLLGLALSGICETSCESAARNGFLIGAGSGLVLGTATGAVVGSLFQNWNEPLRNRPVTAHLTAGAHVTQAGVQFTRGDTRIGLEGAKVAPGNTFSSAYYGEPHDLQKFRSTDVSRDGSQLGIAIERKLAGPLFAAASVMRWSSSETTTIRDWGNVTGPDFSHPLVTTTASNASGLGGSFGVVARHRIAGDVYLRVDARQHWRPNAVRMLTAGLEF